jgi:serine/threonine protein kinase
VVWKQVGRMRDSRATDAFMADVSRVMRFSAGSERIVKVIACTMQPMGIVMEMVSDRSVGDLLRRAHRSGSEIAPALAIRVLVGVTDGLRFLHSQKPITAHGNLKASNVLIGDDAHEVRLTDIMHRLVCAATCTRTDVALPVNTAPEEVLGGPPSPAGDIYAVGILGRQLCVSAERVYISNNPADVLASVVDDQRDFVSFPPSVPLDVVGFIERCHAHAAADRPTADEAHRHFLHILNLLAPMGQGKGTRKSKKSARNSPKKHAATKRPHNNGDDEDDDVEMAIRNRS